MAFTISRIDRLPRTYDINARNADGTPATIEAISFALVPPRAGVSNETVWVAVPVVAVDPAPASPSDPTHEAEVVFDGPQVSPLGDLVVPIGGADLHQLAVDGDYRDAEFVERVTVT